MNSMINQFSYAHLLKYYLTDITIYTSTSRNINFFKCYEKNPVAICGEISIFKDANHIFKIKTC